MKLAKAASETKYWPIICGALDDDYEPVECDTDAILAAVPTGSIREILKPRMEERRQGLSEIMPEFTQATDIDELGKLADVTGIHLFGANVEEPWPTEVPERVSFHTVRELKGGPAVDVPNWSAWPGLHRQPFRLERNVSSDWTTRGYLRTATSAHGRICTGTVRVLSAPSLRWTTWAKLVAREGFAPSTFPF